MAIPLLLVYFARKRKDIPFNRIFWMFGAFIVWCGLTHLLDLLAVKWWPAYRLAGVVKGVTAGVSWATVLALVPLLPRALALPGLEKVNAQLREEVERRARAELELHRKQEELERSNADLERFAYVASHDLQEPLRMVTTYTQLLRRQYSGRFDASAEEYMDFATAGAERMQRLLRDLLAYSRLDAGPAGRTESDAGQALAEALANLRVAVEEADARVTHDPLPRVGVDHGRLVQVFQNLVGNSIKFRTAPGPRIHVTAREEGDAWVLTVEDDGIGVPEDFRPRMFLAFQRYHGPEEYPGSGIGLATCRRIVERHGGRIWIEPRAGRGTRISFSVPRSR